MWEWESLPFNGLETQCAWIIHDFALVSFHCWGSRGRGRWRRRWRRRRRRWWPSAMRSRSAKHIRVVCEEVQVQSQRSLLLSVVHIATSLCPEERWEKGEDNNTIVRLELSPFCSSSSSSSLLIRSENKARHDEPQPQPEPPPKRQWLPRRRFRGFSQNHGRLVFLLLTVCLTAEKQQLASDLPIYYLLRTYPPLFPSNVLPINMPLARSFVKIFSQQKKAFKICLLHSS